MNHHLQPGQPPASAVDVLGELQQLTADLQEAGLPCSLSTQHHVLLVGTPGGGIITAGPHRNKPGWWATSVADYIARDLTGPSLTAAVYEEIARHRTGVGGCVHDISA